MVLGFKYAAWNVRGLGEEEEELDKILNENNIKILVITEIKINCNILRILNIIRLFTVEISDTSGSSRE
jgi:hypothetical protein